MFIASVLGAVTLATIPTVALPLALAWLPCSGGDWCSNPRSPTLWELATFGVVLMTAASFPTYLMLVVIGMSGRWTTYLVAWLAIVGSLLLAALLIVVFAVSTDARYADNDDVELILIGMAFGWVVVPPLLVGVQRLLHGRSNQTATDCHRRILTAACVGAGV